MASLMGTKDVPWSVLAYLPAAILGILLATLGVYSKCFYPSTSLLVLTFFYLTCVDPYSDIIFIIKLIDMEGWTPLSRLCVGHLLSTVLVNCCALFWWFRRIRDRAWFRQNKDSIILVVVLVFGFCGLDALHILQSCLLGMPVFCFDEADAAKLMTYAKVFTLYEVMPQLAFQVIAVVQRRGDHFLTLVALCLSALSAFVTIAKGILLFVSADDEQYEHLVTYQEIALGHHGAPSTPLAMHDVVLGTSKGSVSPQSALSSKLEDGESWAPLLRPFDTTAREGTVKPWKEFLFFSSVLEYGGREDIIINETDFYRELKGSHIRANALFLANFKLNRVGYIEGSELRRFLKQDTCSPHQLMKAAVQFVESCQSDVVIGLTAKSPPRLSGCRALLRFPLGDQDEVSVGVQRAQPGFEQFAFMPGKSDPSIEACGRATCCCPCFRPTIHGGDLNLINMPEISRQHAQFTCKLKEGFRLCLRDLGSTNGTQIFRHCQNIVGTPPCVERAYFLVKRDEEGKLTLDEFPEQFRDKVRSFMEKEGVLDVREPFLGILWSEPRDVDSRNQWFRYELNPGGPEIKLQQRDVLQFGGKVTCVVDFHSSPGWKAMREQFVDSRYEVRWPGCSRKPPVKVSDDVTPINPKVVRTSLRQSCPEKRPEKLSMTASVELWESLLAEETEKGREDPEHWTKWTKVTHGAMNVNLRDLWDELNERNALYMFEAGDVDM